MNTLTKLQKYMGNRKILLPLSLISSGISSIMGIIPLILIWLIAKELLVTQSSNNISFYAWWAVGISVGGIAVYFLALTLSHLAAFRVEVNMRREAMKKIVNLPLGFFENNTSGKIRKIIDDNAGITHTFLAHQMPDLAGSILVPIVALIMIFIFDWKLGLASLIPLVFAFSIISFMMGKKGKYFMKKYMTSLEDMNTEAVEYVRGIPVVKVFQQTIFSFKNFHKSIMNYKDMVTKYTLLWEKPMSAYTVLIHGFVFFLVPVTIIIIGGFGEIGLTIVNLLFFVLITPIFAQNIMRSMHLNQAIGQAEEAITRVENLIDVKPLAVSKNPKPIKNNEICFKNVSFSYPNSKEKAIDNVSFKIPEGKTFALIGASGSGKTTIARLIPRFWDADNGEVIIGNSNVKEIEPKELMKNISFVFQNTKLFKTSLKENITYGKPNATQKEIENAVNLAMCNDIVKKLPNKLNTKIGTKGTYLSGGEQQRICLARAILKDAPIVVLDEATAFVDPENEHLIQKAFETLTNGKTVLMIAHRLTSITDADCILVMNKGNITEKGTHKELIKKKGPYYRMWNEYKKSVEWTVEKENKK
jgi:ATP-binding cassette subfamily B protein